MKSFECADGCYSYGLFDKYLIFHNGKDSEYYNAWIYNDEIYKSSNEKYENLHSWASYLDQVYTIDDLEVFIYRQNPTSFKSTGAEIKWLQSKRKKTPKSSKKENLFVEYISYALRVEDFMNKNAYSTWGDELENVDTYKFSPLISEGLAKLNSSEIDDHFKERYAYQLMKLYRHSNQFQEVINIYQSVFKNFKTNIGYYAMDQYAGTISKLGRTAEANYLFSQVYTNCPSRRELAYNSLKIRTETELNAAKALCKNKEEKMTLHFIKAIKTKALALEDMKAIYTGLGDHEYLRLIISREIHKIENASPNYNNYDENSIDDQERKLLNNQVQSYTKDLLKFNEEILNSGNNDDFWKLSYAYLNYLHGDFSKCADVLSEIANSNRNYYIQKQFIFCVNLISSKPSLTEEDENKIGQILFDLNDGKTSYPEMAYVNDYTCNYNSILESVFNKIYTKSQNNKFKKLIFSGNNIWGELYSSDSAPSIGKIDSLLIDIEKCPETKIAQYAAAHYFGTSEIQVSNFNDCRNALNELKATILMRNPETLDESIAIFETLPPKYLNAFKISGNAFEINIKNRNFGKFNQVEDKLPHQNRLEFAQKLLKLYNERNVGNNLLKLAFAYYNSSYYGLQWESMAYYRTYGYPSGNDNMNITRDLFTNAINSGNLSNDELVYAHYMVAMCQLNNYTKNRNQEIPKYDEWSFNNYFNQMIYDGVYKSFDKIKQLKSTSAYAQIVKECKYFRYYIN
jgi:hypothetical protein